MIYLASDLHGFSFDSFKKMLDSVGFSDDDFLYVLGDVIDRGTDGIKTLCWMMYQPNVQLLLGNHEATMLACDFLFKEITDDSINELNETSIRTYSVWLANGGQTTLDALSGIDKEQIRDILDYLRDCPLFETLTVGGRDFLLVHSGLGNFGKSKKIADYSEADLIWTRPKLDDRYYDDITTVFGHTPTYHYGEEYRGRAIVTDTWINIDVGAAAGNTPMLLRLDDMKEFYF